MYNNFNDTKEVKLDLLQIIMNLKNSKVVYKRRSCIMTVLESVHFMQLQGVSLTPKKV